MNTNFSNKSLLEKELFLPQTDQRIPRLQKLLGQLRVDAILVTSPENIFYLTGFSGSAAYLVVGESGSLVTTDGRYKDQVEMELAASGVSAEIFIGSGRGQLGSIKDFISKKPGSVRLGFEAGDITWAFWERISDLFGEASLSEDKAVPKQNSKIELVPVRSAVEKLREVKDEGEVDRIRKACLIADMALADVKHLLGEEISEKDFAVELEYKMKKLSAQGPAFATIVASGPNSALPHARPTDRKIREGDLVVIDFGAKVDGYHSDMTRTYALSVKDRELLDLAEAVLAAQEAGVKSVRSGVLAGDVDLACRSVLAENGLEEFFSHGTGHGVGLLIHEAPYLGADSADILASGSVVTVEPGAYLFGKGGVRIEDTMVVTQNACEVLTQTVKEFIY